MLLNLKNWICVNLKSSKVSSLVTILLILSHIYLVSVVYLVRHQLFASAHSRYRF